MSAVHTLEVSICLDDGYAPVGRSKEATEVIRPLRTLVLGGLLLFACDGVSFVERVVLVNEVDYPANVDVRGDDGGWLGLSTVPAHQTREIKQLIDQGDTWTFRFSYGKHESVVMEIAREELMDAGWRVEVPDELERILHDEGVPLPP